MSDAPTGLPTPGQEHELLKPFEGTFKAVVRIFTGQGDPIESTGIMKNKFVLGGLYLEQDYQGDPTDAPMPPFSGKGMWGYNFYTKQYEGFWVDNASSMMQREDGSVSEDGRSWEMHSEITHPQAGLMKKRSLIRMVDENHHEMESFMTPAGGEEMKTMEISYNRHSS